MASLIDYFDSHQFACIYIKAKFYLPKGALANSIYYHILIKEARRRDTSYAQVRGLLYKCLYVFFFLLYILWQVLKLFDIDFLLSL